MNVETLNIVNLDDTSATYKAISNSSGGGGNSGGGGDSEMPVIGDGKTYLYVDINPVYMREYRGKTTLQLKGDRYMADAITIDWGDGNIQTTNADSIVIKPKHTYAKGGKYIISLDIKDGVVITLGDKGSYYGILGNSSSDAYGGIILTALELGKNIKLEGVSFQHCYGLSNVVMSEYIQELTGFKSCYGLSSIIISNSVTSINGFDRCYSLRKVVVGTGVNTIKGSAFNYCKGLYSIDFSSSLLIPTLEDMYSIPSGLYECSIIVPDDLYDEWVDATNWSGLKKFIIKKSDWDALQ